MISPEARARDFRDQADRHRRTAGELEGRRLTDVADRYLGWATDLERRAVVLEEEAQKARDAKKEAAR